MSPKVYSNFCIVNCRHRVAVGPDPESNPEQTVERCPSSHCAAMASSSYVYFSHLLEYLYKNSKRISKY